MKFFFIIILISSLTVTSVNGQEETPKDVPRLRQELSEATSDTSRILLKCQLAEANRENKPDTSLIVANQALAKSREVGFRKGEIRSLIVLCVLNREKGNLPRALELGLKAVRLSEVEQLGYERIYAIIRVGNVYLSAADASQALVYFKLAEEALKQNYDEHQWSATQFFLSEIYLRLNDLNKAGELVRTLEEKHPANEGWEILTARQWANIAVMKNDLPTAIKNLRKSYQISLRQDIDREAATSCNALASVFNKTGQADSAIFYAKEGLRLGEKLSYPNRILAASSLLAELYSIKDPMEAVKYFQIASAAKDSLYGAQKFIELQSTTMKELDRKTMLEKEAIAYRNRVRFWILSGSILVVIAIAVLLYRNNRQKQKANAVLQKTLSELRSAQAQLIHSEKMASLGELTAGIAHEIQNPLNFVNNFSEVNSELISEMKSELDKGNLAAAKALAADIDENEKKIVTHGKRADSIVKSMLQHSRTSSGQKGLTDINALCDEYLRLAYHGLRAKDKSFNAKFETDLDPSLPKINVVAQDIGRVVLNLINNAFYAVSEKAKNLSQGEPGFEPTVSIGSKQEDGKIVITIRDNGTGMSEKVREKVFHPFFTTKPTGQGTGLGLSLSYDIVKTHGGNLELETQLNVGSIFTIKMPVR